MFIYLGSNEIIKSSVELANLIYDDVVKELMIVPEQEFFEGSSNVNMGELANIMELHINTPFYVETYWYWSKRVNGKYIPSTPNKMYINTRGYAFNSKDAVFNLVYLMFHEHCHFLDHITPDKFFHHFDNRYKPYKEMTAPYFVDNIAEKIIMKRNEVNRFDKNRDASLIKPRFFRRLFLLLKKLY